MPISSFIVDRIVSLGQIEALCIEQSPWPENVDSAFVVSHHVNIVDDANPSNYFRFLITTRRLINILGQTESLHTDATYKARCD